MNKIVDRINWVNDTDPALNETNLNQMDSELDALDDRVLGLVGDCEAQAEEAEAWAVGERGGDPTSPGDPTYQNNSKYYAQQAAGSATTAGNSATAAGNSALSASGSATTAGNQALVSEGYAKGTQNGTPVGSGSPYYHNNAEYFKDQAQQIAGQTLGGLSDVDISGQTNGDLLVYNSTDSEWKNEHVTAATLTGNPISLTTSSQQPARATKITLTPIQASGTPTPSSPLKISGYDNVSLDVVPKNMLNADKYYGTYKQADGTYLATASQINAIHIPVGAFIGTEMTFSVKVAVNASTSFISALAHIDGVNRYGTAVYSGTTGVSSITFTPASVSDYIMIGYGSGGAVQSTFSEFQLELGSTATAFEPFTPITLIAHSFPTTIYGGEVDIERGLIRKAWERFHADGTGGYYTVGNSGGTNYVQVAIDLNSINTAQAPNGLKSTRFATSVNLTAGNCYITANGTILIAILPDQTITTTEQARAWFAANPTDFVYELATPYEIQLTPRIVNLLQGANVITSNGTSVEISYRNGTIATLQDVDELNKTIDVLATETAGNKADIATKTDLSAIAPIEAVTTASQAYAVGDYFVKNGDFCRCISPISSGSAFTLNTNYSVTKVGTQLASTNTNVSKMLNVSGSTAYLDGSSNWDNVKTPGLYYVNLYDGSGGQGAFPVQAVGQLLIMNDDIQISQIFFSGNAFGYRAYTSGAWETWKSVTLS